ncbi:hypothetical protein BaRGS_00023066 [Batillaria attramentaria]|uniref:Uncharacterized protein n=1 Tax=Batillaria attramentaria TaxID=370345 RepID=A0ABD0KF88_9CAEN
MAKNHVPPNNFEALIELQQVNGCTALKVGVTWKHHSSVQELEDCLLHVTKAEITEKVEKSDFVGIITDETLNYTLYKKLIVYARKENEGHVEMLFLGNYTIDNGTSDCVFEKLTEVMRQWGLTDR